ncbi:hypothetical protein [Bradyrhizobium sp. BRP22]|uniref:hypothetical protein n=1 Tax=Bradyrhizobium sp. BRP22 TaxID=2793821 RepID=UPI001CD2DAB6
MSWDASDPLDSDHAARWHALPLLDGLQADLTGIRDRSTESVLGNKLQNGIALGHSRLSSTQGFDAGDAAVYFCSLPKSLVKKK